MKRNTTHTEIKKYKIFAIYHEQTLQFFIGITATLDMKSVHSHHYSMKNGSTKELFKEYRESIYSPKIYVLQTLNCTLSEANSRRLAFIKYFCESGYSCLNKDYHTEQSEDLSEYTESLYNEITQKSIEEYLSLDNHILLNYGRKRGENTNKYDEGKKQINFRVTDAEYEIIKSHAEKQGVTLTAYMKDIALKGQVLNIDFAAIREHTNEISRVKQSLNAIIQLFADTREIYDSDIMQIVNLVKSINKSEKKLLKEFLNYTTDISKFIKK